MAYVKGTENKQKVIGARLELTGEQEYVEKLKTVTEEYERMRESAEKLNDTLVQLNKSMKEFNELRKS